MVLRYRRPTDWTRHPSCDCSVNAVDRTAVCVTAEECQRLYESCPEALWQCWVVRSWCDDRRM